MTRFNNTGSALLLAFLTFLLAAPASTADARRNFEEATAALSSETTEPLDFSEDRAREIDRDAADLPTVIRPRPVDVDVVDTAMVFTNTSALDRRIVCVGLDKQGTPVGRVLVKLPALGLRYVLASDLSNGADFVGSAQCSSHSTVKGSAIFLGPGITDLSVGNIAGRRIGRIRFHVVATY